MANNKGQTSIGNLLAVGIIILALMGGAIMLVLTVGIIKETSETVIPSLNNLPGTIGDSDVGDIATKVTKPVELTVSSLGWLLGVIYVVALIGLLGVAKAYNLSGQKQLIFLFILVAIMVVLGSIIVSNTYQNMYESGGAIGEQLRGSSFAIISFLLLYSPAVITVIIFIAGILMFVGLEEVPV